MKKSAKVLIGIVLVLALGAAGTFGYLYFSKNNSNVDTPQTKNPASTQSVAFDGGSSVATVNGISIIADDTGVRVFNEADRSQKKIFDRPARISMFDGETAYFTEAVIADENITFTKSGEEVPADDHDPWYRSKVYSYNIESDKVEELFTCNYGYIEFVAMNDGNIYYTDCDDAEIGNLDVYRSALCLYKYNVESKDRTKLIDYFAWNERVGDKVYYQADLDKKGIDYHELYCFDLKTETSNLITDEKASVIKIEDNAIYYLTCTYFTDGGIVTGKDYAFKKTDLTSHKTETVTELDFYEAGEYELWADCVGDEVYFKYASTASVYDFDDYSYNLKTNTLTKLEKDDIAFNGFIHNFGSLSVVEYVRDNDGVSDSVTELYRIDAPGKYTKIYESADLLYFKLTENGLYKTKPYSEENSIFEIEFISLEIK